MIEMYDDEDPPCSLGMRIRGRTCNKHHGHGDFQVAFWLVVIVVTTGIVGMYLVSGGIEERIILHEKINVMSCSELSHFLSETTSTRDIYRAEQNYKWECTENKVLELES